MYIRKYWIQLLYLVFSLPAFSQGFITLDWEHPSPVYEGFETVSTDMPGFAGAVYGGKPYLPSYVYTEELGTDFCEGGYEAVIEYPEFEPSDIEYRRSGKSYTYNTIIELYKMFPNLKKVYFLIGTDAFRKIETWYNTEELKKLVKFIVFIREEKFNPSELNYLKDKGYDFEIQKLPFKDISSTKIRELLKNRKGNVKSDIPEKVMEYIEKNGLYNS